MAGCMFKRKTIARNTTFSILLMTRCPFLSYSPVSAFLPTLFCVFDDSGGSPRPALSRGTPHGLSGILTLGVAARMKRIASA